MLTSQDYNVGQAELPRRYYNRQLHLHGECFYRGLEWFMWEDNRKLMTPIHSECFNYASENEYAQVRYAQGDWQTRDYGIDIVSRGSRETASGWRRADRTGRPLPAELRSWIGKPET